MTGQTTISEVIKFADSVTGKEVFLTNISVNIQFNYIERTSISDGGYIDSEQKLDNLYFYTEFNSPEKLAEFIGQSPDLLPLVIAVAKEKAAQPLVDLANAIVAKQNSEITSDEGKI